MVALIGKETFCSSTIYNCVNYYREIMGNLIQYDYVVIPDMLELEQIIYWKLRCRKCVTAKTTFQNVATRFTFFQGVTRRCRLF
jgi:hypothetical protein